MTAWNLTVLPDNLIIKVLDTSLEALYQLVKCPIRLRDITVLVQSGDPTGYAMGGIRKGFFVHMIWAIDPCDRTGTAMENATRILGTCVHEFGHCLDRFFEMPRDPMTIDAVKRIQEIRANEYRQSILSNLTSEQNGVIRDLTAACDKLGDAKARRNCNSLDESSFDRLAVQYWKDQDGDLGRRIEARKAILAKVNERGFR